MRQYTDIQTEIGPIKNKPPLPDFFVDRQKLNRVLGEATKTLLNFQHPDGYWWFTLEANPAIDAGFIQLMYFLSAVDANIQNGLSQRILQEQREDGSWGLYYGSKGDLSTSIECYFSLRLAGLTPNEPPLQKAKTFILGKGGLTQARVFTRIHLALFGLVPWEACPVMPIEMILLPPWAPMNIYHFSSWARASIVPLLVVLNEKPTVKIENLNLNELYCEPPKKRQWSQPRHTHPISIERLFLLMDRGLQYFEKIPFKPWRRYALEKAIAWVWEHIQKTEDIYPALAYGAMAFKAAGFTNDSPQVQTCLNALKSFQQFYVTDNLPSIPQNQRTSVPAYQRTIHQQCCISPVWDTPWSLTALIEANPSMARDPNLIKAGRWLLSKEIQNPNGDWRVKNPDGKPGGWSFEFKNEYFPDVDDTIQVIHALNRLELPPHEKMPAIERGLAWILSMQNDDGGFAAFDKNNDLDLVNKIPFSDHGACLDPSTPDITGRVLELLLGLGFKPESKAIKKAFSFLKKSQERFGGWYGRWGVNYIYGTWCVLTGFNLLGDENPLSKEGEKACQWLMSIQNEDGGFSESPESYVTKKYTPYPESVPSQTAWASMALIAANKKETLAVKRGIQYLLDHCHEGIWEEPYFTGTGFPGHFYIRYHGYRYYFPLLTLARYGTGGK